MWELPGAPISAGPGGWQLGLVPTLPTALPSPRAAPRRVSLTSPHAHTAPWSQQCTHEAMALGPEKWKATAATVWISALLLPRMEGPSEVPPALLLHRG